MNVLKWVLNNLVGLILAIAIVAIAYRAWHSERDDKTAAQAALVTQRKLTDSTVAVLASERADKTQLKELLESAKKVNGALMAGLSIHIAPRETTIVNHPIVTVTNPDSTRTGLFSDSTFAGTISGMVTAPPCCAPLAIQYSVKRPAFDPKVGFIQVGNRLAAVVSWQGEEVTIEHPYGKLEPPTKRFIPFADALVDPTAVFTADVGVILNVAKGFGLIARVDQRLQLGEPTRAGVGIHKEF
jgi:hypothetical protein